MKKVDKIIKIIHPIFFLCLLFSFSIFAKPSYANKDVSTALCFINDTQNRMLIVRETLSGKIALPGDQIGQYEKAEEAAIRGTLKKTGINVVVNEILTQQEAVIIFGCQSKEKIPIYELNHSLAILPFWSVTSFSSEIQAVYLAKFNLAMLLNSKFPSQASLYSNLLTQNQASEVIAKANFSDLTFNINLFDERLSSKLQHFVQSLPVALGNAIDGFLRAGSWFGSLNVLFLIIPLALATGGIQRCMQLIMGLMIIFTLVTLIKIQFEIPRPSHVFPHLMKDGQQAQFSFPSIHSATSIFIWISVCLWFQIKDKLIIYICVFPTILTSMSRIYIGANYLMDIFIGSILGMLIIFFTIFIQQKSWSWLLLGLVNLSLAFLKNQPVLFYIGVFSLTYICLLWFFNQNKINSENGFFNIMSFVFSFLGMAVIWMVFKSMKEITPSNNLIMLGQSICIILLTVWISVIVPRVSGR